MKTGNRRHVETLQHRKEKQRRRHQGEQKKSRGKTIENQEDTYLFDGNSLLLSDVHRIKFVSL